MEQTGEPAAEVATAVPWDAALESLFAESIRNSWYLPEPDGSLSGGNYVNIPQELTERVPEASSAVSGDKMPNGLASRHAAGGLWSLSLLQYKQLTEDVYAKIRETFGSEECLDWGRPPLPQLAGPGTPPADPHGRQALQAPQLRLLLRLQGGMPLVYGDFFRWSKVLRASFLGAPDCFKITFSLLHSAPRIHS